MTQVPKPVHQEPEDARQADMLTVIGCGAIAREIVTVLHANRLDHVRLTCLPAILHNTPRKIIPALEEAIASARAEGAKRIFLAYADCGTGGLLDRLCEREGIERIAGPHCYSFYYGNQRFADEIEDHTQTYWLTDFLARQFDAFVTKPLKLDRYPELKEMMFGNYERIVYIAQEDDPALDEKARAIAADLGLAYERRLVGYGDLIPTLVQAARQGD